MNKFCFSLYYFGEVENISTDTNSISSDSGEEKEGVKEVPVPSEQNAQQEYNEFINSHKEIDEKRIRNIINSRFKKNKELEEQLNVYQEQTRINNIEQRYKNLQNQSESLLQEFPEVDLKELIDNSEFTELLAIGVPMKSAFLAVKYDYVLEKLSASAKEKADNYIKNASIRPYENGLNGSGGITLKQDVSKLTKLQRAELAKRSASGETITF